MMKIIVKKVDEIEKKDFPNSIAMIQLGNHCTILTESDVEIIIDKLIMFSKRNNKVDER